MTGLDKLTFVLAKASLPLCLKNLWDAPPAALLNLVIGINKLIPHFTRQTAPNGRFTHPHKPDEVEVWLFLIFSLIHKAIVQNSRNGGRSKSVPSNQITLTLEASAQSNILEKMENNVVHITVKGVMPTSNGCAVFLGSEEKTFVIYVDRGIGEAIQQAVDNVQAERPMTHDLMITLLDGLGAEVERVVINDVKDGTFFARLIVSMENEIGHKIIEVDARPSDSITLALGTDKPIYVAREVLDSVDDMTEILAKILEQNQ